LKENHKVENLEKKDWFKENIENSENLDEKSNDKTVKRFSFNY